MSLDTGKPSPALIVMDGAERASTSASTAQPVACRIGIDDLPVARTEVELSAPPSTLASAEPCTPTRKILVLVRLHSHPLGILLLDGVTDRRWTTHSSTVWAAMRTAANHHLVADGLPMVDEPGSLARTSGPAAGCLRRRTEVLRRPPHFTVVVATRERPDSLLSCLSALEELDYPRYDVVVVDNDPLTKDTAELVADHFSDSVHYVREDRRGLARAHNRGLAEARGTHVAFVDDDVVVDRHWLTGIAEGFAAAERVGCVTGLILPAQLDTPAQLLLERHGGFDKGFELRIFDTGAHRPEDPLFPFTAGRFGSGANMAFDAAVLRRLGGFDPTIGTGTFARGGDDLAAFFRVVLSHRVVYQPAAIVWHRHHRDMAALRNQAFGYGVGLGAYLTSVLVHDPRMLTGLLRRLPRGVEYTFGASSERNRTRYDGIPDSLARLERRGVLFGPAAYAVSRWRTRTAATANTARNTGDRRSVP